MLIGTKYADNKMYRGIRHYDGLPLTSSDLHEYADTLHMKNAYIMNNIIGSGTLNEPTCIITDDGVSLDSPSVLMIDGDISLIQSDTSPIVSSSTIRDAGYNEGILCIIGWYQLLTANSVLRAYGGVSNTTLENDLLDPKFKVQVSTRYQLRWDTVVLDREEYESGNPITLSIPLRDEDGNSLSSTVNITTRSSDHIIRTAEKPTDMEYAISDLYLAPILEYTYEDGTIVRAESVPPSRPTSANNFVSSAVEPEGDYDQGTVWYNTLTHKFLYYVQGVGFVPTAADLALVQYTSSTTIDTEYTSPSNILVSIGIESYEENDILQVIYNGVVLTSGQHYVVDPSNKTITLNEFTTEVGDIVSFLVTKLVDTTSLTSISNEFSNHINLVGDITKKGHVALSDTLDPDSDVQYGIAATPKSVYDATTIVDSVTSKKYRITVTDGELGIVEVV